MYSSFLPSEMPTPNEVGLGSGFSALPADLTDLARQFRRRPWGPHPAALRALIARMRSGKTAGKYALQVVTPFREWQLVRLPADRGVGLEPVAGGRFTSLAEAEWAVFRRRALEMFGQDIPADLPPAGDGA